MKERKGLTLVEVLLSMAIIGIVSVIIITIFGFSLKNISRSGKGTQDVLELESKLNQEISKYNDGGEGMAELEVKVNIPGIIDKRIRGNIITEEVNGKSITTFVPSKDQD